MQFVLDCFSNNNTLSDPANYRQFVSLFVSNESKLGDLIYHQFVLFVYIFNIWLFFWNWYAQVSHRCNKMKLIYSVILCVYAVSEVIKYNVVKYLKIIIFFCHGNSSLVFAYLRQRHCRWKTKWYAVLVLNLLVYMRLMFPKPTLVGG